MKNRCGFWEEEETNKAVAKGTTSIAPDAPPIGQHNRKPDEIKRQQRTYPTDHEKERSSANDFKHEEYDIKEQTKIFDHFGEKKMANSLKSVQVSTTIAQPIASMRWGLLAY